MKAVCRRCAVLLLLFTATCERVEPGAAVCHPDCTKFGNCGEDGHCKCPFGRLGEACEIDFLAPCRQFPGTVAQCDFVATKSCECLKRCRKYFCETGSEGRDMCHGRDMMPLRGCYVREGVPADEQYSRIPEANETSVTCFQGYGEGAQEMECSQAMLYKGTFGEHKSLPLSECPDQCTGRGHCLKADTGSGYCACERGYSGDKCETKTNLCYRGCSGRGKCEDHFCHCKPPYFSIGCTRSKVYPANHSRPSPVDFKIYMYELPTKLAYENAWTPGSRGHHPIYTAYIKFLDQFLVSAVRTEDPSKANLFFIPAFTLSYSGNTQSGNDHLLAVMNHVRQASPYWNRTGGRDHFFWTPSDRGACQLEGLPLDAMKITHFGLTHTPDHHGPIPPYGPLAYGCAHPLRDVVAAPVLAPEHDDEWLDRTAQMSLDDMIKKKTRMLFFSGGIGPEHPEFSGGTRQAAWNLTQQWGDPEYEVVDGSVGDAYDDVYEQRMRSSKFCLAPYGYGWGNRVVQAMQAGCVPLIVQEHVIQAYEDILPYEDFSLRLANADLPHVREILRGISDVQYRRLLEGVRRYRLAFSWNVGRGGLAFEFTIASLRRKHLNLKALYFGTFSSLPQCQAMGEPEDPRCAPGP